MPLFKHLRDAFAGHSQPHQNNLSIAPTQAPPQWAPAPERSHTYGLWNEAPEEEFEAAEAFCVQHPPEPPRLLPSDVVDRIATEGCGAWGIELPTSPRFVGRIQNGVKGGRATVTVETGRACRDVCLLSDLPLLAGLYDTQGKTGVYFEVLVRRMDGVVAIGEHRRSVIRPRR